MSSEIYDNSYVKYISQFKANNIDNTKTIENQWIAVVDNLSEYYKSRIIIKVKAKEKIIFQLFGFGGYVEKFIASKLFLYSLPLLAIFGFTIAFILWMIDGPNLSYFATLTGIYIITDVFTTIHFLNTHKILYSLIFNTFDFTLLYGHERLSFHRIRIQRSLTINVRCCLFMWFHQSPVGNSGDHQTKVFAFSVNSIVFDHVDSATS